MNKDEKRQSQRTHRTLSAMATIIIAVSLFSAGCDKAMESYNEGSRSLDARDYDRAVRQLAEALDQCRRRRSRDCTMFEERLAYARRTAAEHYYAQAHADFVEANLDRAAKNITKAIEYDPQNASYVNLRQTILAETVATEQLRRDALEFASRQQWDAAIDAMQKAIAKNRQLPNASAQLDKIRRDTYTFYLNQARALFDTSQWDQALVDANHALDYYPDGREAKEIVNQIANRREALTLINEAMQNSDNPEAALITLQKAQKLYPSHPQIDQFIIDTKRTICDTKIAQAAEALRQERLNDALRLLNDARNLLSNYGGIDSMIADVNIRVARRHTDVADQFRNDDRFGNAALHYLAAMYYVDVFPPAASGLAGSIVPLRQSVVYSLGFVGLNSAWQDQQASNTIEAALLQHINRARPANIIITDASAFKLVLRGINNNITDVDVFDARIQNTRPADTDALMMGQLLGRQVTTTEEVTHACSEFQSGTELHPNPEYRKRMARLDELAHRHEDASSELASANALAAQMSMPRPGEDEETFRARRGRARTMVEKARENLDRIHVDLEKNREYLALVPPHVATPVISKYEYPIVSMTRTGKVSVLLKVVDAQTGAVLLAQTAEGTFSASDRYVNSDPAHNVPADPLQIPDDSVILQNAAQQAIGRLNEICDAWLRAHSRRFVAMMKQAVSDNREEAAVEYAMQYLICPPEPGPDKNTVMTYLRTVVARRNESTAPDLTRPFAKYYKP